MHDWSGKIGNRYMHVLVVILLTWLEEGKLWQQYELIFSRLERIAKSTIERADSPDEIQFFNHIRYV